MSSENHDSIASVEDADDWSDGDLDDDALRAIKSLDGRRMVEKKLEDLRLRRETSEYLFDL